MKIVKRILLVLLVALIALQFYRPEKNDAEYRDVKAFQAETAPSKKVVAILESKCFDCHSNKTVYPWYGQVAPISLWMNGHIQEGKEHLNLTNWASWDLKKKDHKLEEVTDAVEEGWMPEEHYVWIHGGLSDDEKEELSSWAKSARESLN